jgi:hypothetical protein
MAITFVMELASVTDRFWSKVDWSGGPNACWLWTAYRDRDGYGNFGFRGKNERSNRVAWIISKGEIPDGMFVCHSCDNPSCCNPRHLFLGNHLTNVQDRVAKFRSACGSMQTNAKLMERDVRVIRALYKLAVAAAAKKLAKQYNISRQTVHLIVHRKSWRHI